MFEKTDSLQLEDMVSGVIYENTDYKEGESYKYLQKGAYGNLAVSNDLLIWKQALMSNSEIKFSFV